MKRCKVSGVGISNQGLVTLSLRERVAHSAGLGMLAMFMRLTHHAADCRRRTSIADPLLHAHVGNLSAARARALAASSSRFFGGALVSSESSSVLEAAVI